MSEQTETEQDRDSVGIYSWKDNKGRQQEIILHYEENVNARASVGEHDLGRVKLIDVYHGTHLYPSVLISGFDIENALPTSPDEQFVVMLNDDIYLEIEGWFQ